MIPKTKYSKNIQGIKTGYGFLNWN